MYQRSNLSQNMNPAQRLDILKKEMEHLAVEKEILQAQTRNLEMEKEVCKLRQGILALQSNTGVSTSEATGSKATTNDEIVVTPRRIVKKSVNKSPIQPAFSPPRFIRRHEEPEEDRPPILTPAARMIQASLDLNKSQSKPVKASTFIERKQTKRRAEESVHQMSTPPLELNDNSPESSRPAKRQRRSNLERFNDDDDEFDSIDIHANKHKSLVVQKESSPSKSVKLENKNENVKSEVLTPTARLIKAEMEKKQAEKDAAEKAKQDALKAKIMAKEMKKKTADQDVSFSLQRPQPEEKIDEPTTSSILVEQSINKKQTGDELILTQAAIKVQSDLDLKKTVIHRTENIVVTETRKQVVISPKIISEDSSSESESKLTPTARAVKELMESKLQAQKKTSPKPASQTIKKPASQTIPKPASQTITKPASPVSPTVSKPVTPALPDTPKSRGVHFAKVERVHLNKPYVPEKVMTPEKVKGIIKPPRLTRRPLHPERVQLKPRKSTRGNVCFSQTTVEDAEDSIEEEESEFVTNSQTTTGDMSSQSSASSRPSIKSRGRKRQIETDSSNDDFSEIEESAVTSLPTKRRRTYVTTPHPVKGRRRSKVAAVAVSDDDENDYADVSDTSDAVSDKPSPKRDTKPVQKRGRNKKAVVEVIQDEVPEKDNSQDKEEDQLVKEETPIKKEKVPQKTTKSKTTKLKQTKKGKESSKASESNEESEKNEEIVMSTPTKKRRSSLLSRKIAVSETENKSEDVKSTPTKKKHLSLTASTKIIRRVSEDNDESEDSTIGTPSKRRRSILQKSSRATSSKMADIPEDKSVPTPAQREIIAKMNAKSTSKGKKKEDSEESSPEKTATEENSKSTQASKGKKKEDSVDGSTVKTATTGNSKSTQASKGKKKEDSEESSPEKTATTVNSKSTQASKGKKKEDSVDSSSEKTAATANSKSTQASKGKKKEDSEDSSPEKTATTVNSKSAQASKGKKKEDSEDSSTEKPATTGNSKSTQASKGKKKEDSEDSSAEKTATTGKKAGGSKGKEEKIEHKPNLTPAARLVLARMQERENSKKTKGTVTSDVNTDSDASDASKKKSKRK